MEDDHFGGGGLEGEIDCYEEGCRLTARGGVGEGSDQLQNK